MTASAPRGPCQVALGGRRRHREHPQAERDAEVDGREADTAAGTENEHRLARPDPASLAQCEQTGEVALGEAGGLPDGQRVGNRHHLVCRCDHLARVPTEPDVGEDAVADRDRRDVGSHLDNGSGGLHARYERDRRLDLVSTLHDEAVDIVDAARRDRNSNRSVGEGQRWALLDREAADLAELPTHDNPHVSLLSVRPGTQPDHDVASSPRASSRRRMNTGVGT